MQESRMSMEIRLESACQPVRVLCVSLVSGKMEIYTLCMCTTICKESMAIEAS